MTDSPNQHLHLDTPSTPPYNPPTLTTTPAPLQQNPVS